MKIVITQKIIDYIEQNKVSFEGISPKLGEEWKIERVHTYSNVNNGEPVVEVINGKAWMRLPENLTQEQKVYPD